jgi:hypothetical protein
MIRWAKPAERSKMDPKRTWIVLFNHVVGAQ